MPTKATLSNDGVADMDNVRLWASNKAGQNMSNVQNPSGGAAGQTANNVNSTVPATATLSNTAAGYTTLGGNFVFAAPAGAETDYALFAFLNPAPPPFYPGHGNGNGFPEHQSAFDAELALLVRNRETVLQFVQFICATDLLDS